ncbi:glucan biosynthesis protein [Lysobacter sp. F60174L2]|uniref:glucan biosynthesis protein n=1 Tax=Lysobacter sp. F60174L2 TaxID=3459295 RepID=UPI00403DA59E
MPWAAGAQTGGDSGTFDAGVVSRLARGLASRPFAAAPDDLPAWLSGADYDRWRDIRFRPGEALWRGQGRGFELQFFHRGYLHRERVRIDEVIDGKVVEIPYQPDQFDFGKDATAVVPDPSLGFAGFRAHAALNTPDYLDEVCAFLGASYFRAVARGEVYGLSARGLALGTGDPRGEEFPRFTRFWIERPASDASQLVIHALLDGPSASGAFRFVVTPGVETVFDVDMRLYPRVELDAVGIAPLTSMYYFDSADRAGIDDFRDAVHDSDGLALHGEDGSLSWRPLQNPPTLQESSFDGARGFGLMQRKRRFEDFGDSEARYHDRPSLWVEPGRGWGKGRVHLFELPTADEYQDNIVAFWRPRKPLKAGAEHHFSYRLHWGRSHPWQPGLARVTQTRAGAGPDGRRHFVIDFDGGPSDAIDARIDLASDAGQVENPVVDARIGGGWRAAFLLDPADAALAELRLRIVKADGTPLSETWLYRWIR